MRSLSKAAQSLACALLLAGISVTGCSPTTETTDKKSPSGTMPETSNLKEQMEEKWLAEATNGLSFTNGTVLPTVKKPVNKGRAIELTKAADKSLNTENIWFKAAGMFRDAILVNPEYAPAYEGLGRALLLEGNLNLVEPAFKTAVRLDPSFSRARFELGTVIQMRGDFSGSVAAWKELVDRDPSYPDAYARMSIASYFAQDYASAYAYLDEADKRKQNVPPQFRPLLKEAAPRP